MTLYIIMDTTVRIRPNDPIHHNGHTTVRVRPNDHIHHNGHYSQGKT